MTKAEELKILEAIEGLILEAGPDSYIRMTFAGVPEICRRNIEDDFGNIPVQDLEDARNLLHAEERRHDETKRMLAEAQKYCKETLDALSAESVKLEEQRKLTDEWEKNAHDAGEMYCDLEEEIKAKNAEIVRLKAELAKMRFDAMSEIEMAFMYDQMTGKGAM